MDEERQKLIELIKILPDDRIKAIIDFVNHMLNDYPFEDPDDELLMR